MTRVLDNTQLLSADFTPDNFEEPQLIFRRDTIEEFDENFCYGRRPKIELFWRLGIPGKWTLWKDHPWDQKRRPASPEAGEFGFAGWVARLFSGMENLELDTKDSWLERGCARQTAIVSTLQQIDLLVAGASVAPYGLKIIDENVLEHELAALKIG